MEGRVSLNWATWKAFQGQVFELDIQRGGLGKCRADEKRWREDKAEGVSTSESYQACGFLLVSSEDKAGTVAGAVLRDLDSTTV